MAECPTCGCNNVDEVQKCEKCATALLSSDLRCGFYTYGGTSNGQVLQNRYIITRELSSDFTGVKYLADDVQEKKDVIIWALPTIAAADEDGIQSLSKVCDGLIKLKDEHILSVSGVYSKMNARYIVQEYVDGCSLEQRIESDEPLNIEETLELFGPVADSIDFAHKQGFVHGDISPANILIGPDGIVKLANFAISKAIKDMLLWSMPEEKVKPSFCIAPEQLENAVCSQNSDVYSLAACIYLSLCDKSFEHQGHKSRQKPEKIDRLSERQNIALLKSLSVNPHDRHQSAVELLAELRDSADKDEPIQSEQMNYEKSLADLRQKIQEQSREYEEIFKKLIADAEKEKQQHSEMLIQVQNQAVEQAEQKRNEYEEKIRQLIVRIEEAEAKNAAALNESSQKTEMLEAEKNKLLQHIGEQEETIKKLVTNAEEEGQKHAEMLNQARMQAKELAERQSAEFEQTIGQHKETLAQTQEKLAAALSESKRKTEVFTAERERALQKITELEETINKLIADAEKEKQQHLEKLTRAMEQDRERAEQSRLEYEKEIERLEVRIKETDKELTDALSENETWVAERKNILRCIRENERTLVDVRAEAQQQQKKSTDRLKEAKWEIKSQSEIIERIKKKAARTVLISVIFVISVVMASAVTCGIVLSRYHMSNIKGTFKHEQEKSEVRQMTKEHIFSEFIQKANELEADGQWEEAVTEFENALKINKDVHIEEKLAMCRFNLYLSQAITAHQAEDMDKAVELYTKALTYNDDAGVRDRIESARKTQENSAMMGNIEVMLKDWLEEDFCF